MKSIDGTIFMTVAKFIQFSWVNSCSSYRFIHCWSNYQLTSFTKKMKIFFLFFWACVLQRIDSNSATILVIRPVPDCISVDKFNKATKILCENKTNSTLWQQLVDCHTPIKEEVVLKKWPSFSHIIQNFISAGTGRYLLFLVLQYLRKSGAANCPNPQLVDPTDPSKTIQEIFSNFCTLGVGPSFIKRFKVSVSHLKCSVFKKCLGWTLLWRYSWICYSTAT